VKVKSWLLIVLVILVGIVLILRFGGGRRKGEESLIAGFEPGLAHKIVIDGRERQTMLEKQGDIWIVTSEDSFPAEAGAADKILEAIQGFSRRDIVSTNPEKRAIYQVDSTGTEVRVEDATGVALASFVIGKVGPDYQSTFVRNANSDEVVLAAGYLAGTFERGKRTWQDLAIFALQPSSIAEMRLSRPAETFDLARNSEGQWYMARPESAACDQNRVQKLARALAYLRSDEIVGRMPLEGSGLDQPDSLVWFRLFDGTEGTLLFGAPAPGKSVYAKRQSDDVVYRLPTYRVHSLLPELERLLAAEEPEPQAATPTGPPATPAGQ
jgi:hypothetical protein